MTLTSGRRMLSLAVVSLLSALAARAADKPNEHIGQEFGECQHAAATQVKVEPGDGRGPTPIDLAGAWKCELDPQDVGVNQRWFARAMQRPIRLPGRLDEAGYGAKNEERSIRWLNRRVSHVAPAWYQRTVDIPANWQGRRITAWNYDSGNLPPQEATADIKAVCNKVPNVGAMLLGEKGNMYVGGWGAGNLIKLKGEDKLRGVNDHPAAKALPVTEPRAAKQNHMLEWIEAAKGGPKTYQSFDVAAHAMEVILPAIISLRMQRAIDWDGPNMKVPGAPEADEFIQAKHRQKWLL